MATLNKAARAALAKETINKQIPSILASNPRASSGVQRVQRLLGSVDLPKLIVQDGEDGAAKSMLDITIRPVDTLEAARYILDRQPQARVAVLNMASPLQPGGGVLRGARAQEESLCMRSTLYPSLRSQWYRHKPDTVIYTPDVLVFKSPSPDLKLLDPKDQIYVDVISCAAPRHPDVKQLDDGTLKYEDPKDEEAMALKIKYIMRTAVKMSATHVVLGAIGCGAYRNPIKEVAGMMRRCLLGRGKGRPLDEDWAAAGVKSIVFAILDDSPKQLVWNGFVEEFAGHENVVIETIG
ncbi:hypothetical protein LTR84_000881 [Exophiala bonariae]|uniref:Microbial-type PARG catalytic domain-containing protein n=1 Tax=Exophiala bonariae TaxID=1690606 RepID=A0AAV9NRU5_9EURO|nr:hypothetical protein LTR84_000881 [Exophiala bonariae]